MLLHASWNGLADLFVVSRFGFDMVVTWYTTGVDGVLAERMEAANATGFALVRAVYYASLVAGGALLAWWLRYGAR